MRKLSILLLGLFLCTGNVHSKEVEIVNVTPYDLVVKLITIHDYFQFVGGGSTGPGPVTHGYDLGNLTNYSYSSTVVIVPAGQTVDLYDYVNGSYNASLNNTGSFPFGWNSTLNPFYNNVFPYSTVGGVDVPSSTVPITLPMGYTADSCVKSMHIGLISNSTPSGGNFVILKEMFHNSDEALTKTETDGVDIYYSRYEHRPLTAGGTFSQCVRDRITFGMFPF